MCIVKYFSNFFSEKLTKPIKGLVKGAKKIAINNEFEELAQILTKAAKTITANSEEIQESAENIVISCQIIPGTNGEAQKDMLLAKVDDLERVVALCNSASNRLMNAARKLVDGVPKDKVLSDVFAYSAFFYDQLKSEENDVKQILSMLRENCQ